MNCAASIVKYILYIFNLLFAICGILIITMGAIMLANLADFSSFYEYKNSETLPILIIILGCIVFIVSFFGCCGAIKENICCLTTYAIFMFILLALQIALISWIFAEGDNYLDTMSKIVNQIWADNDEEHGYPMDLLQTSFKCCGLNSYQDYNGNVPNSCCGTLDTTATCLEEVYSTKPGCHDAFLDFWSSNNDIIRYAGIGVAVVELVAFIFACCIACSIRRSR